MNGSDTVVDAKLREKLAGCQGKLCVHKNGFPHKSRVFTIVPGFSPNHNLGVYNNCVDTVERAFIERYFLCKVGDEFEPALRSSDSQYQTKWLRRFRKSCLSYMPHLPRLTLRQALDLFPAQKRRVYEKALESFSSKGDVTQKDALLASFVKFEKQDVSKAPRVINPRSPRFNLKLATFLKHYEHHMFVAINRAFGARTAATVIKGFDADRSGEIMFNKWSQFSHPVAVGLDAAKFDMHVSKSALRYEHSFYNEYWRNDELRNLLRMQEVNKGTARVADGEVKFSMQGTRSSGDLNTSLGNCIIMCGLVFSYAKERGIRIELANNGDDCVVFCEAEDLDRLMEGLDAWFAAKGFRMTVEDPVYVLEEVEFCQTHPVCVAGGWRMVRNPMTCLKKDVMCLRPMQNEGTFRKWLYAVGSGGELLNSGVPILSQFYSTLKKEGVFSEKFRDLVSPYRFGCSGGRMVHGVDDETRASFFAAFRILPAEQEAAERFLRWCSIEGWSSVPIERDDLELSFPGAQILDLEDNGKTYQS